MRILGKLTIACSLLLLAVSGDFLFAQTAEVKVAEREVELRRELADVERQIAAQQQILKSEQVKGVSLERDIAILNAEISQAKLKIRAKNIEIERLGKDINVKSQTISVLSGRIEKSMESLAQLIRKTNELDSYTVSEMALANQDLSDFFSDLDYFDSIKKSLYVSYTDVKVTKNLTETEKESLNKKRNKELDLRAGIESEKRKIERSEAEKKRLLGLSKQQQKAYETVIKDREKRAAEIRSALFALRDSAPIPFGLALEYANLAFQKTGVRPAFLLAILTQESNLGQNVGTCNRVGDPPEKGWQTIMNPKRDHEPFLKITAALGLDPNTMPLSCPWQNGWGGAMGPSQFIPSTWGPYAGFKKDSSGVWSDYSASNDKIRGYTGSGQVSSPWNPRDAFMASSIYLRDLGASEGTFSAEKKAALMYYAGSNWNKASNQFYGNQVMTKATSIQETMIDPLKNL